VQEGLEAAFQHKKKKNNQVPGIHLHCTPVTALLAKVKKEVARETLVAENLPPSHWVSQFCLKTDVGICTF
jgi:hypothetical protein